MVMAARREIGESFWGNLGFISEKIFKDLGYTGFLMLVSNYI